MGLSITQNPSPNPFFEIPEIRRSSSWPTTSPSVVSTPSSPPKSSSTSTTHSSSSPRVPTSSIRVSPRLDTVQSSNSKTPLYCVAPFIRCLESGKSGWLRCPSFWRSLMKHEHEILLRQMLVYFCQCSKLRQEIRANSFNLAPTSAHFNFRVTPSMC